MREQTQTRSGAKPLAADKPPLLQRKCGCGDKCNDCEKKKDEKKNVLQRFGGDRTPTTDVPPSVSGVLRSPGRPLDSATRARFEPRFGFDFSRVRVHADEHAHDSTREVGAIAYTVGHDVAFSSGQYRPGTSSGDALLAHELAHVVQQRGAGTTSSSNAALEADADRSADLLTRNGDETAAPLLRAAPRLSMRPMPGDDHDRLHSGIVESFREQHGLPSADQGGPSDAQIKYQLLAPREDLSRIRIEPVSDFLVTDLTATQNVGLTVTDSAVKSIEWQLHGPDGVLLPDSVKTKPGDADALTKPFQLKPSQFSKAAGFKPGRHTLTVLGLSQQGLITVRAVRDFNVLESDLTTGTAVKGTHGELTFTQYSKTDAPGAGSIYSIRVVLSFLPKSTIACNDIVYLQAGQALDPTGASLLPLVGPEINERSTPMAWSIDHAEGTHSPYYLTETDPGTKAMRDDARFGTAGGGGATPKAATLDDTPKFNKPANFHFESCAVCRSGTDVGKVFSCATWGYSADALGKIKLFPRSVHDTPSWIFKAAGEGWNKWNKKNATTPARLNVPELKS